MSSFLGSVPQDRVPEIYNAADIYLTTPNIDNMPGSLLECFASGLPVIATRAGGIPYILEHERTGLMVPINDHEGPGRRRRLSAAGRSSPGAEQLTANARRECERYRSAPICEQWAALYRELRA